MSRDGRRRVDRQGSFIARRITEGVGYDTAELCLIIGERGWIEREARRRGAVDVHLIALPLITKGRTSVRSYGESHRLSLHHSLAGRVRADAWRRAVELHAKER